MLWRDNIECNLPIDLCSGCGETADLFQMRLTNAGRPLRNRLVNIQCNYSDYDEYIRVKTT